MSVRLDQHMQKVRLLWAAMLASVACYALVAVVVTVPAGTARPADAVLVWVLGSLAALDLLSVMPIHGVLLRGARLAFERDRQLANLLRAHLVALVVAWAQIEVVAVLGLAILFAAGQPDVCLAFIAVAGLSLAFVRPTLEPVKDLVSAADPGSVPPISP